MTIDPVSAVLATAACALLFALGSFLRKAIRSRRAKVRATRARRGEAAAAALLEAHGFAVTDVQATSRYALAVGDREVIVSLRADYLVSRGGRSWVAEVKTGELAPKIESPATRRQLLEYRIAFAVDGVLLVDVERSRVDEIRFPGLAAPARTSFGFGWLVVPAVVAIAYFLIFPALR